MLVSRALTGQQAEAEGFTAPSVAEDAIRAIAKRLGICTVSEKTGTEPSQIPLVLCISCSPIVACSACFAGMPIVTLTEEGSGHMSQCHDC